MEPGDLVEDRFEVVRLAGAGAMGSVYAARDRRTGELVALKLVIGDVEAAERFAREALVLRRLDHPGIVRYVAHGRTEAGAPYLAMEWLAGEDLEARLSRGRLSIAESVTLGLRVASALGAAHAAHVVHRDVKPSNLFLEGGSIERVKVLDFGIARLDAGRGAMTRVGALLGTPAYMAPEQARGQKDVDARADIFSLGCVLFECLTGEPPFMARDVMAVLAKVLLEDSPRLRTLLPDAPPGLDELVARMLAKDPTHRPADGAAALAALGELGPEGPAPMSHAARALTEGELRMICVVLVAPLAEDAQAAVNAPTLGAAAQSSALEPLAAAAAPFGLHVEPLADGSLIGTLAGAGASTEKAAQAARAALALRAALPEARIALATGKALVGDRWPVGAAIDRAAALVRAAAASTSGARPVLIDDRTSGLLDARFDVREHAGALALFGERETWVSTRTLLGKPTPCVGRERELAMLEAMYGECVEDSAARAVLVLGEAGIGKSRLRHELLRALERTLPAPEIWMGRGDPMSAGAPFSLIAPSLRSTAGILAGEPVAVRRRKLAARIGRHVGAEDQTRVSEFMGELLGTPFPDDASVQLREARADATLMGDQTRRAWEDFLAAETAAHPVVIVLEDLHFGDRPTVRFIDAALRNLQDRPLFVLALARPEVSSTFPDLWRGRRVDEIRLGPLKKKGIERLARAVLGEDVGDDLVARLVERSDGNAFYLEELLRAVAEGSGDAMPETVLAMVEQRLLGLAPESRRVLRAASVFGQVHWSGAVAALVGRDASAELSELTERELFTRRRQARFPGEIEHTFRAALVREAAYSMLTEGDRRLGHKLAGEWLERAGETDAVALAEHFERGGEPLRALGFYRRAAEQALDANDFAGAIERAERGVRCGATGEALGLLRLIEADAHRWIGDNVQTEARAREASELLPRGGELWCTAMSELGVAEGRAGNSEGLARSAELLRDTLSAGAVRGRGARSGARLVAPLFLLGLYPLADALLIAFEASATDDPVIEARLSYGRAIRASMEGDTEALLVALERAVIKFEEAGDLRNACMQRANVGYGLLQLGAYAEAECSLREALARADRLGLRTVSATAKHNLGLVLARGGGCDEGLGLELAAAESFRADGDRRMEGCARNYAAVIRLLAGEPGAAEEEARAAVGLLEGVAPTRCFALATLAAALLASGRAEEGLGAAREAAAALAELGHIAEGESEVLLAHAEALLATGARDAGRDALELAQQRLLARAEKIREPRHRQSFLEGVPAHARTVALARELLR